MADNLELFVPQPPEARTGSAHGHRPLADELRPDQWAAFEGLEAFDKSLVEQLRSGRGRPPSLVLWGPPGCGKTTLAKLIGNSFQCHFVEFSAVLGGVKDVRAIIAQARKIPTQTVLFVDEIHRFNKAQQDAFLPHVENGTIVLIGATTENPSFYLNGALLSRARVVPLSALSLDQLAAILKRAADTLGLTLATEASELICQFVGGDARRMLNLIESYHEVHAEQIQGGSSEISKEDVEQFLSDGSTAFYDRDGEEHYNMASAFIKSMRGSDADAALYWGFRMIESGEDPRFIIRRMMIFASEDIGNADPRALQIALATSDAYEKIGFPEGKIPIAQCMTYLATAPKSNRSYLGMKQVLAAIQEHPKVAVPLHLRNAPTGLMKDLGYGDGYTYPHDVDSGFVQGEQYLPDEMAGRTFYQPSDRGYELRIKERLQRIAESSKK
jgi:putative ATPase